jgi:hypothetical protein
MVNNDLPAAASDSLAHRVNWGNRALYLEFLPRRRTVLPNWELLTRFPSIS